MQPILASVGALLTGIAVLLLGNGLLGTLVGTRTALAGMPAAVTAVIMSAYFTGQVVGSIWGPRVIHSVGHIRAFAAFASVLSACALGHAFVTSAPVWALLRGVTGFCMAGLFMVTESWLNARATNETRGRILSLYMLTSYAALGCGQFLLALDRPDSFMLFGVVSVLVSLSLVPVAMTHAVAPRIEQLPRFGFRRLYSISPLGMTGALIAGLVVGAFYGMGPVFGEEVGLSVRGVAILMGVTILGGLLLQWPVGRFSDLYDRRTIITSVAVGLALASLAISLLVSREPFAGRSLFLLAAAYGGLSFPIYSLCVAHTNDHIAGDRFVEASSGLLFAYGIGAAVGPIAVAATMHVVGSIGLFVFSGIMSCLLAGFAIYRMTRREAPSLEDQGAWMPLPRTSAVVTQLAPAAGGDATTRTPEDVPDRAQSQG